MNIPPPPPSQSFCCQSILSGRQSATVMPWVRPQQASAWHLTLCNIHGASQTREQRRAPQPGQAITNSSFASGRTMDGTGLLLDLAPFTASTGMEWPNLQRWCRFMLPYAPSTGTPGNRLLKTFACFLARLSHRGSQLSSANGEWWMLVFWIRGFSLLCTIHSVLLFIASGLHTIDTRHMGNLTRRKSLLGKIAGTTRRSAPSFLW